MSSRGAPLALCFAWIGAAAAAAAPVDFSLPTTAERDLSFSSLRGKVVVLFYEDRGTRNDNQPLKDSLKRALAADAALGALVALLPVANVSSYDFWPARWFARRAVTSMAREHHLEIWIDFKGALKPILGVRDGVSNVVVLDRTGEVRLRREGALAPKEIAALVSAIRTLAQRGGP